MSLMLLFDQGQTSSAPPYAPSAAKFNGTTTYMQGDYTYGSDEESGFVASLWFKARSLTSFGTRVIFSLGGWLDGGDSEVAGFKVSLQTFDGSANSALTLQLESAYYAGDYANPSDTTFNYNASGVVSRELWYHLLLSYKQNDRVQAYLNDSALTLTGSITANPASFYALGSNASKVGAFGVGNTNKLPGDLSEIYFSNQYTPLDLTVTANRRLFITSDLRPVDLGVFGSTPGGVPAPIYFKSPFGSFGTNSGADSNFTVTGTLATATVPTIAGQA